MFFEVSKDKWKCEKISFHASKQWMDEKFSKPYFTFYVFDYARPENDARYVLFIDKIVGNALENQQMGDNHPCEIKPYLN